MLLEFEELTVTSTHVVLAFLLVLLLMLQMFCLLMFRLRFSRGKKLEFLFWEEIQDHSCVISITLETLLSSYQLRNL